MKESFSLEASEEGHDKDRASSPDSFGAGGVQAERTGSLGGAAGGSGAWGASTAGDSDVSENKGTRTLLVGLGVAKASGDGHHGQ